MYVVNVSPPPPELAAAFAVLANVKASFALLKPALAVFEAFVINWLFNEIEIGIETQLVDNRIILDASYFDRTNTNLITQSPIANSTGYLNTFTNIGRMEGDGFEFDLGLHIVKNNADGFNWRMNTNFTTSKMIVKDLGEGQNNLTIAGFRFNAVNNTGYAFRFATGMTVTTRSPYIRNITVISRGSVTSPSDPYGFLQNDAGKGALVDGSVVSALSNQASMLFHSVTFFTPNQECITATNGVRIEWLNSFSYFADKGLYGVSGSTGFAGAGETRLRIDSRTGTWAVGNTVTYYDTDGTTVLASGTIASVNGNYVNLTGKNVGFETITDRIGKTVYAQGNAKLSTSIKKFGTASLALDGTGDYATVATQPDFAFPSTISRIAKTITVNGDASVSATQSKFSGSSVAFDGTGDYLSIATDTDYGFGTGDFTIEGWFYKTVVSTQYLFDTRTTLNENSVAVQSNGSGSLRLFVNGVFVLTSSNAHTNNAWNHLAISRASGVTRFFINGVVSTTTYTDTTDYGTTKPLVVGAQYNGTTAFAGYIDDFRVSNTARYTATFTPSTTAFVADSASKLLIHGDVTISDDVGGTVTDFTLESWIYRNVSGAQHIILDFRTTLTQNAPVVFITSANILAYFVNGANRITGTTVSTGVWHHVALSRSGTSTKLFFNGTQVGSTWTDTTDYIQSPLTIGSRFDGAAGNFNGYIDDVRISKGVARYTANFTPPTEPFPNFGPRTFRNSVPYSMSSVFSMNDLSGLDFNTTATTVMSSVFSMNEISHVDFNTTATTSVALTMTG
jgi:hypothetical protein